MIDELATFPARAVGAVAPFRILIVDDEPVVVEVLSRYLTEEGYICVTAREGNSALDYLRSNHCEALISDILMPGMDGIELLQQARVIDPELAVIMITGQHDRKIANTALRCGAYEYLMKPLDQDTVLITMANALERRRLSINSRKYEQLLEAKVEERTAEIFRREEEITLHLVAASEFRDEETGRHIRRIGLYSSILAIALGWVEEQVRLLRLAAPMHDVGKIGIPDHILLKQDKLSTLEFDVMKRHTQIGASILNNSHIPLLNMGKTIAFQHHERWDGSGYPQGLLGDAIEESARIVTIADVYDALVTDRVYRPAFPEQEALDMLRSSTGRHIDPHVFECFMDVYPEIHNIRYEMNPEDDALDGTSWLSSVVGMSEL